MPDNYMDNDQIEKFMDSLYKQIDTFSKNSMPGEQAYKILQGIIGAAQIRMLAELVKRLPEPK